MAACKDRKKRRAIPIRISDILDTILMWFLQGSRS